MRKQYFCFEKLLFDEGGIEFTLKGESALEVVSFRAYRMFCFVNDTDFWTWLRPCAYTPVVRLDGTISNTVYESKENRLLKELVGQIAEEEPSFFYVLTPDECFQIVGFAAPTVRLVPLQK